MNQAISVMEEEKEDLSKQNLNEFIKQLESLPSPEDKLRVSITFMREALSQTTAPNFKGFWEVRKLCLPLFKETLSSPIRSGLWAEYIELTREGRRLKNLLDEETAFACEQIDLAISALEAEIKAYHENPDAILEKAPELGLPDEPQAMEGRYSYYDNIQTRLNLLNVFASRINSLRKELMRTEMRIRQKNKFFQRLSQLGDFVFPPRKEYIREISENFIQDVEKFVQTYFAPEVFSHENVRRSVFFFREEIKTLQSIAKILTLNTHAFSVTREELSKCWDMLKGMEKELKKEFAEQKQVSAQNTEQVRERIAKFKENYAQKSLSLQEAYGEIEAISRWMRELDLTRTDVKALKEELREARQPLDTKQEEEEVQKKQKEAEFEKARKDKIEQFKDEIEALKQKVSSESIETLTFELEESKKNLSALSLTKSEKQLFDRNLKTIRDHIEEKQQQALLALSADDRAQLDNLVEILEQRKQRRKEIKSQIEEYRKIIGGSALDFEKAMKFNELMAIEKERLGKLDEGISEIENKIHAYKKKS